MLAGEIAPDRRPTSVNEGPTPSQMDRHPISLAQGIRQEADLRPAVHDTLDPRDGVHDHVPRFLALGGPPQGDDTVVGTDRNLMAAGATFNRCGKKMKATLHFP